MTVAPASNRLTADRTAVRAEARPLVEDRRLTGAPDLRAFIDATRTALRFLHLPEVDRARVVADLELLEAEAGRTDLRPRLVAGLRFAVETTVERHVGSLA